MIISLNRESNAFYIESQMQGRGGGGTIWIKQLYQKINEFLFDYNKLRYFINNKLT